MSTLKLGQGLLLLGAACVGAGLLAVPLLHTSGLLWLSGAGGVLFAAGLAVLVVRLLTGD